MTTPNDLPVLCGTGRAIARAQDQAALAAQAYRDYLEAMDSPAISAILDLLLADCPLPQGTPSTLRGMLDAAISTTMTRQQVLDWAQTLRAKAQAAPLPSFDQWAAVTGRVPRD